MSEQSGYKSFFPSVSSGGPAGTTPKLGIPSARDIRDGDVYLLNDDIKLAVDVAIATTRPLLLRGEPGSGKSSLAAHVARRLNWRYYEQVITSRTTARDLLWTFDSVQKLADASTWKRAQQVLRDYDYIEPGVLWWAINPESARLRGLPHADSKLRPCQDPGPGENEGRNQSHSVVLLDEIDKADPDVPNGLLVPLGSLEFRVTGTTLVVRASEILEGDLPQRVLVIITTNEERELPPAFLRRCVVFNLPSPTVQHLISIGREHRKGYKYLADKISDALVSDLARVVDELRHEARGIGTRPPSTAEYLDALWACANLEVDVDHPDWLQVRRLLLEKSVDNEQVTW